MPRKLLLQTLGYGTINIINHTGNNLFSSTKLTLTSQAVINAGNGSYNGSITLSGSNNLDTISPDWNKTTRPGTLEDLFGDLITVEDPGTAIGKDYRGASQQFNKILSQYGQVIKDGSYLGNNLLLGQSLKVIFNETSSSYIKINGVNASLNGLNLAYADWNNSSDIQGAIADLDEAISKLRNYSREFGNYYNTINIREKFTNSMINILQEGADKLTLADINQASADILSLQTRQQLAVNSLSLASEVSRSVLKLFM